jgi:hypothetical protein
MGKSGKMKVRRRKRKRRQDEKNRISNNLKLLLKTGKMVVDRVDVLNLRGLS